MAVDRAPTCGRDIARRCAGGLTLIADSTRRSKPLRREAVQVGLRRKSTPDLLCRDGISSGQLETTGGSHYVGCVSQLPLPPERDDASAAQAEELDRLLASLARLVSDDENQICCHDITMSEFRALKVIEGGAVPTMHELVEALGLSKSGATRVVDRLEAKGYARRIDDLHDDGRFKGVRLTARGTTLLRTIAQENLPQRQALLNSIPPAQRQTVIDGLRALTAAARRCC